MVERERQREREKERERERDKERKREEADELGLMELKAKLVSAPLLMYWIALNTCTNPESGKKDGRERVRKREREKERRGR